MEEVVYIDEKNYKDYLDLDVVAFSFAHGGAQGSLGEILVVTKEAQMYSMNYAFGNMTIEMCDEVCPPVKDCVFGFNDVEQTPCGWEGISLGAGNFLVLSETIAKGLKQELLTLARHIEEHIARLAESFEKGKAIKEGIPVAIIGKTNVGKSTLLNRLLNDDKAIVSDIHGTTRDVIEDTTVINDVTFRFIDTAGIRNTSDKIEQLGIERTYQKLQEAAIVVWLIDNQPTNEEKEQMRKLTEGKKLIIARNKTDLMTSDDVLSQRENIHDTVLRISAKMDIGIHTLENAIYEAANIPQFTENDTIVTSARHYEALKRSLDTFKRVIEAIKNNISTDLVAEDLRIVLSQLSEITGKGIITPQETLNNIFSNFCIGK